MSEKPFDHYLPFETLDFVMDEEFQSWVQQPTDEQDAYWQAFMVAFPHKATTVNTARLAIGQLRVSDWTTLSSHQLHERFQTLLSRIDAPVVRVIPFYRRAWVRVAASLLLGLLGWQTYRYGWAETQHQTAFGEQQRILLDDQTVVTLAANSTLRVPGRWLFGQQREVWITGEAYFEVTKQPGETAAQTRNFIVHTRDLNVEVLGTRFNVNTFRSKTTVHLDEGKVQLSFVEQPGKTVVLRPGQMAERPVHQSGIHIVPSPDPTLTTWRDGRLLFKNVSLADLSRRVEEVHGLTLVYDGEGWNDATYTGELPTTDPTLLSHILAETFGAEVTREDNQLILHKSILTP